MLTDHNRHIDRWLVKEREVVLEKRAKEKEFVDEILRSTIYSDIGKDDLESGRHENN